MVLIDNIIEETTIQRRSQQGTYKEERLQRDVKFGRVGHHKGPQLKGQIILSLELVTWTVSCRGSLSLSCTASLATVFWPQMANLFRISWMHLGRAMQSL